MRTFKPSYGSSSTILLCFMGVVLAVGIMIMGTFPAYAVNGQSDENDQALTVAGMQAQAVGDVYVGSIDVSAGGDFTVDGVACSYDASTHTLTLSGDGTITSYLDTSQPSSIYANVDLDIVITGDVSLKATPKGGTYTVNGLYSTEGHSITISGTGTLKAMGRNRGIKSGGAFTIYSATVYAQTTTNQSPRGIDAKGAVEINGGAVYAWAQYSANARPGSAIHGSSITFNSANGVVLDFPSEGSIQPNKIEDGYVDICNKDGDTARDALIGVPRNHALFYIDGLEAGHLIFRYGVPADPLIMFSSETEQTEQLYAGFDTAAYTSASHAPWYANRTSITTVEFDSSCSGHLAPTSTAYWFYNLTNLTSVEGISNLDTSNVTDMSEMFHNCYALSTLDVSHFNTSNVTSMYCMFDRCGVTSLDLTNFNTANVTDMTGMFANEGSASKLASLVFGSTFTTASVKSMNSMFMGCDKLETLDVSHFNTSSVTNMMQMFNGCKMLTTLDLSNFNTKKVTTMESMFCRCANLETLTLGNDFASNELTTMNQMFSGCRALTSLVFPESFTAAKVESLSMAFGNCESLVALDLSGFTTQPTYFSSMLSGCSNLETVNVSNLNTSQAESMQGMFNNCSKLASLDLSSFDTRNATNMNNMFNGCGSLASVKFGPNFRFKGKNIVPVSMTQIDGTVTVIRGWALLPTPNGSGNGDFTGNWWKDGAGAHYSAADLQDLTGDDIAGTWSWAKGYLATVTAGEGGTASACPTSGSANATATLTAQANEGYEFARWELVSGENTGSLSSTTDSPAAFTFGTSNGMVRAVFTKHEYTIGAMGANSFTYNGKKQVPTVTVRDKEGGVALTEGTHYTVTYEKSGAAVASPVDAGVYTVYVTGKGDYAAMAKVAAGTFTINPAKVTPTPSVTPTTSQIAAPEPITIAKVPASVKAKASKNKVTVSWKAIKKTKKTKALLAQIKSIQVQCSTDPVFSDNVIVKKVGKKKTKAVLKLKKKTTYYVRVRYVGADGYSNWSKVRRVKTK